MAKKQKRNEPAYQRPITVLFLLQLLLLVKFGLFCVVFFMAEWWGVVNRWPIGITLFSLHLLFIHFILSYPVSLRVSLDSLLYHLLLRQSSITVRVRRSTHLLFMISWCTFHSPEGFARNTTSRAWGKWLTSHKLHGWGGWVVASWTWLSRDSVQAPCNS